ncbi:uncharacterized protein LOC124368693 isoform X2 [Homalodisca vitripennis]|uniref:uncharacterized protein LOC124368693 isoform X2 n=1 Tax=Homalodisca vitripennis TaxID=197043 RepID=UPI001EEA82CF|nr:uncharacterized protein LOC124368693 isoform X2 [Homalodisca vitripennis]
MIEGATDAGYQRSGESLKRRAQLFRWLRGCMDYDLAHTGECTKEEIDKCCQPGFCPTSYSPVCGLSPTKGYSTFDNTCFLHFENNCNNGDFALQHSGPCTREEINKCQVSCTLQYEPVCGLSHKKGYKTFGNRCSLTQENTCFKDDYVLEHDGECSKEELETICTAGFCTSTPESPVCGMSPTRGYLTFPNECYLHAENTCNYEDFAVAHTGVCTKEELGKICTAECCADVPLAPVCALSPAKVHHTFKNLCYLNAENMCKDAGYEFKHNGKCTIPEVKGQCPLSCTEEYKSVCGYSGTYGYKTFSNKCVYELEINCYFTDYEIVHDGDCTEQELGKNCELQCSKDYRPVCGLSPTVGYKTFTNKCIFVQEISCLGKDYVYKHGGVCKVPNVPPGCPASCTKEYNPVCSFSPSTKTFKTFSNKCLLAAHNKCSTSDNDYLLVHSGECTNHETQNDCNRNCGDLYSPVCGISPTAGYKNFKNICLFVKSITCSGSDYSLAHEGSCTVPEGPVQGCPVICTQEYRPVCAFSSSKKSFRTFSNLCQLEGSNKCKYDSDYIFVHSGACTEGELGNNCSRTCVGQEGAPVCAVSGTRGYATFSSLCDLILSTNCRSSDYQLSHTGNCKSPPGQPEGCPILCSSLSSLGPICAFSLSSHKFKSFISECVWKAGNKCYYDNDYVKVHSGECTIEEIESNCTCTCDENYNPVCGHSPTLGYKSYQDICSFILDVSCLGSDFTFSSQGVCVSREVPPVNCSAPCPLSLNSVCGYDTVWRTFKTFAGDCELQVENSCNNGNYVLAHSGSCTSEETGNNCQRTCSKERNPVCGLSPTLGYKTISNICLFILETSCYGADYVLDHPGECTSEEKGKKCHEKCTTEYSPVCGRNPRKGYMTFPNLCELEVANKCSYADYSLVHDGKCTEKERGGVCNHICPLIYDAVCGYSSIKGYKTFASTCFMDRENSCTYSDYTETHSGKCTPEELGNKCNRICELVYSPVCGNSPKKGYKTFPNFCLLDRENSCDYQDFGVVHNGECFAWELCVNCG